MAGGDSVDHPQKANLNPAKAAGSASVNGITLEWSKVAAAAAKLNVQAGDVISVGAYRNHAGQLVPDYTTLRIEKRNSNDE